MPLTSQARRLLDRFEEVGARPYDEMTVLEARATVLASMRLQAEAPGGVETADLLVAGAAGRLPARLYRPAEADGGPLVVYFHGGGWVTGGIEVADHFCRALAADAGCAVVSVEYRLSPETRFPDTPEDCHAATAWLAERAGELGSEPGRLVLCGDSAGGNLAAAVTLMSRDRGGPEIERQILLYSPLARPGTRESRSHAENGIGYGLTLGGMEWFWSNYLASPEAGDHPYASPLLAPDLAGLPPAGVLTTEFDLLRDESVAYAARLAEAGVPVELEIVPGVIHGFLWLDRYFEAEAAATRARLAGWIGAGAGVADRRGVGA